MSYYELPAEGRGYYLFDHRALTGPRAHFHGAIELAFVESGSAEASIDGESRVLTAGQACFADSFRVHFYRDSDSSSAYILVGDKSCFEDFFRAQGDRAFPKFFAFSDFAFLEKLYSLCGQPGRYAETLLRGAAEMLLGRLAESVPLEKRDRDRSSELVCKVLRYAEANVAEDLSLSALSRQFGYSREHLSRILGRYLPEGWKGYVNRLRAVRAEELLAKGEGENVLKIAYACGFDSPNAFYRAYRKEFGKNPRRGRSSD